MVRPSAPPSRRQAERIVRALPWRQEIEFAEFLVEADRLVEHPLLLVVVANFDEAGEREILAQGMALEPVIRQQPAHVGMAGEDHAVEVVGLALEPVGAGKYVDDRRHLRGLVGYRAQADARVQRRRQQMIDHVEALFAAGIVDRGDVGEVDEAASGIVAQEFDDFDDLARIDVDGELVERDRMGGSRTGKRANNRLPQGVELAVVHYLKP